MTFSGCVQKTNIMFWSLYKKVFILLRFLGVYTKWLHNRVGLGPWVKFCHSLVLWRARLHTHTGIASSPLARQGTVLPSTLLLILTFLFCCIKLSIQITLNLYLQCIPWGINSVVFSERVSVRYMQ